MNSRTKGKVGEREWAGVCTAEGYPARRGVQFQGGTDSPDVVCDSLKWAHFEVKRVERLNMRDAVAQASGDAGNKTWFIAHRWNNAPWLVTMTAETYFALVRGTLPPNPNEQLTGKGQQHIPVPCGLP